ncbi:MAG: LysR family transcriptional regulator [Pseudomonadota bacterium]
MDIRRMGHVVALAEARNFGKAAALVHLSQPAFSRSIQAAENEWGMKLFERGAEVRCTASGAFVVEKSKQLLQSWRALERDVALYRDRQIGELSFGMGPFPAGTLLDPLLLDLRTRFPGVQIRVQVNNPTYLLPLVRSEQYDFFVGDVRYARDDSTLSVTPIGKLPGAFYVRAAHALAAKASVRMSDMSEYGFATGRLPAEVQEMIRKLMGRTAEEGLPVALECDEMNVLKSVTLSTDAVLVATPGLVRKEIASRRLVQIVPTDLPAPQAEVGVISLRGRTLSPIAEYARAFLGKLMESSEARR